VSPKNVVVAGLVSVAGDDGVWAAELCAEDGPEDPL
jgi:hypothetical protein